MKIFYCCDVINALAEILKGLVQEVTLETYYLFNDYAGSFVHYSS